MRLIKIKEENIKMAQQLSHKPTISINIRDSIIMIHKNTLRMLGTPEFIQILVNPADKSIVLCCSFPSDPLAHPVNDEIFSVGKKSYRLHSYTLLQGLHKIYPVWNSDSTYRIYGKFFSNLNIVKFNMRDSLVSGRYDRGEEYE